MDAPWWKFWNWHSGIAGGAIMGTLIYIGARIIQLAS